VGDLEIDTRLEAVSEGRFRASLARDWQIWGPNGGYLACVALRAAGHLARIARPASIAGHFLGVADFDTVDVDVRMIKGGRRSESLSVAISQQGRPIFEGLVRTAAEGPGLEHDVSEMPDVPPPAQLKPVSELLSEEARKLGPPFPFWQNFDEKPVDPSRFAELERRPREPSCRQWYRFKPRATFDDPWLDAGRSLLMIDTAGWIAASQPHPNSDFVAPNLDVTVWFHRFEPDSEWLLIDQTGPLAEGGLMSTHGRVWSESGKLLASGGAQLFCVPRQKGPAE
jgi:acyl-CoA thioesterase-2